MSYTEWKDKVSVFKTIDVRGIQGNFFQGLKKQAMQIDDITPLFEYVPNERNLYVPANSTYHTVLFFKRFTIPDKHNLFFEVFEKNGGRHLQFTITNHDLLSAKVLK